MTERILRRLLLLSLAFACFYASVQLFGIPDPWAMVGATTLFLASPVLALYAVAPRNLHTAVEDSDD